MYQQLLANMSTNLIFYRRNKLLIAASIFVTLVLGLTALPALFFSSQTQHLEQLNMVFTHVNQLAMCIAAGIGLLMVSQHIKDRSIKMVFTKPCLPEIWLLSSFLSAAFLAFLLYCGSILIASVLASVWKMPFPLGIFYITLNEFFQTVSIIAYVTFLSVIFHPVLALMFLFVFHESLFYWLKILIASGIKAASANAFIPLLKFLKVLVDTIYMILPTFSPYAEKTHQVYSSLRGSDGDWSILLLNISYSLILTTLFYLLTVYVLKKKRYV